MSDTGLTIEQREKILKAGFLAALKELDGLMSYLHVHGMIPKNWPIREIVEAKKLCSSEYPAENNTIEK